MRAFLVALLLATACTRTEAPPPAPPPDPLAEQRIAAMTRSLEAVGVKVTEVEQLRSLREFPNCVDAQLRYRIHFGASPRFVNVSRFAKPEEARACLEDFKATALKAGPSAWDRLGPTISTNGPWLYLFPQDLTDGALRKKVVQALQHVQ
ncbi:hypothetical protein [Vulgatibacter sp.]|uniref:hypothetical protein n=1 Tax=Vulgatibacter sp. TaxID=1971226 RepID=UPI0035642B29